MAEDDEPELGIFVEHPALLLLRGQLLGDERLIPQQIFQQQPHAVATRRSRLRRDDVVNLTTELFYPLRHVSPFMTAFSSMDDICNRGPAGRRSSRPQGFFSSLKATE